MANQSIDTELLLPFPPWPTQTPQSKTFKPSTSTTFKEVNECLIPLPSTSTTPTNSGQPPLTANPNLKIPPATNKNQAETKSKPFAPRRLKPLPNFIVNLADQKRAANVQFLDFLQEVGIRLDEDLVGIIKGEEVTTPPYSDFDSDSDFDSNSNSEPKTSIQTSIPAEEAALAAARERSMGKTKTLPEKLAPKEEIEGFLEGYGAFLDGGIGTVQGLLEPFRVLVEARGEGIEIVDDDGSSGGSEGSE